MKVYRQSIDSLSQGMVFEDDGYVYKDNKRIGKHISFGRFGYCQPIHVFLPKISDLKNLEKLRSKVLAHLSKYTKTKYSPLWEEVFCFGDDVIVHAEAKHKRDNPEKYRYIRYRFTKGVCGESSGFACDWEEGEVENLQHLSLGQRFYEASNHLETLFRRCAKVKSVFLYSLLKWVEKNVPVPKREATCKIEINGRYYLLRSELSKNGIWYWETLHFPEQNTVEVSVS